MLVDIDYINAVKKRLSQINSHDLKDIKWIKDGESVSFTKEQINDFEFLGLNNADIIDFYKPTEDKESNNVQ